MCAEGEALRAGGSDCVEFCVDEGVELLRDVLGSFAWSARRVEKKE